MILDQSDLREVGVGRSLSRSVDHVLLNLPTHNSRIQDNTFRTIWDMI